MNQFEPVCAHPGCAANHCNEWNHDFVGFVESHINRVLAKFEAGTRRQFYGDHPGWDANGSPVEAT